MHQDHADIGECLDQLDRVFRLPGIDLQFEMQIVFLQQRKAAAEIGIVAVVGALGRLADRVAVPIEHLPHAAQIGKLFLRLECGVDTGVGQIGVADNAVRKAVLVGDRL